jgi:hypothetical protein
MWNKREVKVMVKFEALAGIERLVHVDKRTD